MKAAAGSQESEVSNGIAGRFSLASCFLGRVSSSAPAGKPFSKAGPAFSTEWVAGPTTALEIGGEFHIYFDHHVSPKYYRAMKSRDLGHWPDISMAASFPKGNRHSTALRILAEGDSKFAASSS